MQAPTKSDAVFALHPGKKWAMQGDTLDWYETGITKPTDSEINAKLSELTTAYNNEKYQRDRKVAYPDIGDQLDDLYHKGAFSDTMAAKLKKVKDDNPKS